MATIIKKYFLASIPESFHQEGYLNLVLLDLVESGKAVYGLGLQYLAKAGIPIQNIEAEGHLIKIIPDKHNNIMILFKSENFENVNGELEKRIIRIGPLRTSDDLGALVGYIDNDEIQKELAAKSVALLNQRCFN